MTKCKVLIVDDHPIVVQGIHQLIQNDATLEVCGEASDAETALSMANAKQPDVAVVDITLKKSNGLDFIKRAKQDHPHMKFLVLSMHDESVYAERALRAGASGYIMKHQAMKSILDGIHRILDGEIYISEPIAQQILQKSSWSTMAAPVDPVSRLSDREVEVFQLYGKGMKTRAIAEELNISIKTVESHREHIMQKLNFSNSAEMLRFAVEFVLKTNGG